MSSSKLFYLPCLNSVRPIGIQCVPEISAPMPNMHNSDRNSVLVGIQYVSEFSVCVGIQKIFP